MVHPGLIVIGAGVALGLSIAVLTLIFAEKPTPNRPYSQRRRRSGAIPAPWHNPSPPPSPPRRSPTTARQRHRTQLEDQATNTTSHEVADRASSPINSGPHLEDRATSPINSGDRCTVCSGRDVVTLHPCGDRLWCASCAENYVLCRGEKECPLCNRRIESF